MMEFNYVINTEQAPMPMKSSDILAMPLDHQLSVYTMKSEVDVSSTLIVTASSLLIFG